MASNPGIKLTYNQGLHRVRVSINCGTLRQLTAPPADVLEKTKKKMSIEIGKGSFSRFTSYANRFANLIKSVKKEEYQGVSDNFVVHLTLAAGIPHIEGVSFTAKSGRGLLGKLNAKVDPKELQKVHPKAFYLFVKMLVNLEKVKASPCEAQVTGIYNRLALGTEISDYTILENTSMEKQRIFGGAPYAIMPQDSMTHLKLVIFDITPFEDDSTVEQLFSALDTKTKTLKVPATAWKNQIKADISLAIHGIERFGLKMPISILAASPSVNSSRSDNVAGDVKASGDKGQKQQKDKSKSAASKSSSKNKTKAKNKQEQYPGSGLLQIKLTDNNLRASIINFKTIYYEKPELNISQEWFEKELKRLDLKNLTDGNLNRALDNIKRNRDINGIVVAEGIQGTPASKPKILSKSEWEEAKDSNEKDKKKDDKKDVDHRNMKNRLSMVKKDDHIAELVFGVPAVDGEDVFGESVPPPAPPDPEIIMDENVRSSETSFYANCEGVMKISGLQISVVKTLIHDGDVNLASGNIKFDGPIIIKGSIDTGAEVHTEKDLTVHGQIRGGSVFVGRKLIVKGGIVTGRTGKITCNGQIFADFIENSNIYSKGKVQVSKAILSSSIKTLDSIIIRNRDGIIAGSDLSVGQNIETGDLGFAQGRTTVVALGSNWVQEERYERNQKRLDKMEALLEKTRLDLRELIRRNKNQMSKKLEELKSNLQAKLVKLKSIVEKLQERVAVLKKSIEYNEKSFMRVTGTLFPTCNVWIKDKEIAVPRGLEEIVILATKHRQSHFIQLDKFNSKTGPDDTDDADDNTDDENEKKVS